MRVAFALGAILRLKNAPTVTVRSFSSASAGAVAPLAYLADDSSAFVDEVVRRLIDGRFINRLRVHRISDIDYLVDEVLAPLIDLRALSSPGRPELWVALVDASTGLLRYERLESRNAMTLLRATMAVPILYGRKVRFEGARYVDGGIGDPLPLHHAMSLADKADTILTIATKPLAQLSSHEIGKTERLAIRVDRRIPRVIRHMLLAPNPLVESTLRTIARGEAGSLRVVSCEPGDETLDFSRTNTTRTQLDRLQAAGFKAMSRAIDAI